MTNDKFSAALQADGVLKTLKTDLIAKRMKLSQAQNFATEARRRAQGVDPRFRKYDSATDDALRAVEDAESEVSRLKGEIQSLESTIREKDGTGAKLRAEANAESGPHQIYTDF